MDDEEWFVVVYAGMCTITEAVSWINPLHDKHFMALLCLINRYHRTLSEVDIDTIITYFPGAMIARCSEEVVSQLVPHVTQEQSILLLQRAANQSEIDSKTITYLITKYPDLLNCNVK
jgi:hypothetical protein